MSGSSTVATQPKQLKPKKPKGLYRVLQGMHVEDGPLDANGEKTDIVYGVGGIVESEIDLCERFNGQGSAFHKFERVTPNPNYIPATKLVPTGISSVVTSTLENMTISELKKFAESEEIDLKEAKTKEEALKIIKAIL